MSSDSPDNWACDLTRAWEAGRCENVMRILDWMDRPTCAYVVAEMVRGLERNRSGFVRALQRRASSSVRVPAEIEQGIYKNGGLNAPA